MKQYSMLTYLSLSMVIMLLVDVLSIYAKVNSPQVAKTKRSNSLFTVNELTPKMIKHAKKSIEIKSKVNSFSLGTSCIIQVVYTNLSNKNISFKEPAKTWEVKMKITDHQKSAIELTFGIIKNLSTNNETHRWVVEEAEIITIAPGSKYEFTYDIGTRWPERFTPGLNTLQIKDELDDDETILSNTIEVKAVYANETFPALLKLLENGNANYDFRLFAEKWIKNLYPEFKISNATTTTNNTELDKKQIAQAFSWWNTHQNDLKVLEQIKKTNPAVVPIQGVATQPISSIQSIGRFSFKVPDGMDLNYREQTIYGLNIKTVPLSEGGIAALWTKKMQDIKALKFPKGFSEALIKEFELLPGVKAAWYFDNSSYASSRMLVAMQQWDKHALIVIRDALEGKEAIAEKLLGDIIQSYQPNITKGFSVGEGAITEGPSLSETTRFYLKHSGSKDITIDYNTLTVSEKSYIKERDLDEEKDFVKVLGGKLKVLKKQKRTVAGIKGQEMWVSMSTPKDGTFIRFSWDFIGVSRDATKPSISISLKSTESDLKELEKIWESLMNSITPRELAEKK